MHSLLLLVPDAAQVAADLVAVQKVDWLRRGAAWDAMRGSTPEFVALATLGEVQGDDLPQRMAVEARRGRCAVLALRGYEWLHTLHGAPGAVVALAPHVSSGVATVLPAEQRSERARGQSPADIVVACIRETDPFTLPATFDAEPLQTFPLPRLAPGVSHRDSQIPNVSDLATAVHRPVASRTDLQAVRAGLLQMHDRLDESHEVSQSIEGEGRRAAGDYWHAIMHRREPDYDNAQYWFRRVGRHPLHRDLLAFAASVLSQSARDLGETWGPKLGIGAEWNSVGFVEMCEQSARDEDGPLGRAARRIQWHEMLLLLRSTCEDAFGTDSSTVRYGSRGTT